MRNLSGRLAAIQVVVHACSCVAFLLDVIVDVAAACREISLSDHTDQGIVAGVVAFGDHLTKQGLYVGSQGEVASMTNSLMMLAGYMLVSLMVNEVLVFKSFT